MRKILQKSSCLIHEVTFVSKVSIIIVMLFLIQGLKTFGQVAPVFTSTPVTGATVGNIYNYNITANDADNDNLSFSVKSGTSLPAWLSLASDGSNNVSELIPSGFVGSVAGMGIDEATGNIYISTQSPNNIYKYTPAGVLSVFGTFPSGYSYGNMIVRGSRLYMGTYAAGGFYSFDLNDNSGSATPTLRASILGIGLEYKAGFFYLCDYSGRRIYKINETDFTYTTYATLPSNCFGIVFDASGYLYASGIDINVIYRIATNGTVTTVLTGITGPSDIKLGKNGDFYISSYSGGVRRYNSDFSTLIATIAPSLASWGMSFNTSGTLLIGDMSNGKVFKLETGAFLSGTPTRAAIGVNPVSLTVNDGTHNTYQEFNVSVTGLALVTTANASSIGQTSAIIGGEVIETGGLTVTERGLVYSLTDQTPTIGEAGVTKLISGSGLGVFNETISTLTLGTPYYYNTYAINSLGTNYGVNKTFTTLKSAQSITFNALSAKIYGDAPFNLTATASSTLAVSYASSNTAVATVSGSIVTIVGQGSTTITASQAGNASYEAATNVLQTLTVNKKSVNITGVTAATKVYDGSATATLSGGSVTTGVGTETIIVTAGSGIFADKNIGTKAVTAIGFALANGTNGGLAANYTLSAQPTVPNQTITAKSVTITGVMAASKAYDGAATATLSGGVATTGVLTETLVITAGIGAFADKNVGSKAVTTTGFALANGTNGGLASNYSLSAQPIVSDQEITAKPLSIADVTAENKIYDGTTAVILAVGSLTGVIDTEDVTLTAGEGAFDSKNVGTGKNVDVAGFALAGADIDNYSLSGQPSGLTADITAKSISIADVTAENKEYNGTTTATLAAGSLTGVVDTEDVTLTAGEGTFDTKNVGTGKTVIAAGFALTGADVDNYSLSGQPSGLTADVTAKSVNIAAVSASSKEYDGTTAASLTVGSLTGIIENDVVTLTAGTGTFDNKNVGTEKAVTAIGYAITDADANNYSLSAQPSGLLANINAVALTAKAENKAKTYGATNPALTIAYTGFISGESKTNITEPAIASVADEMSNVGSYDIILTGGSATNYSITLEKGILSVTKAMLTATADNKTRKVGEANPAFTLAYSGFMNSETDAVIDTKPVAVCNAGLTSAAGDYDITVSGGSDNNYDFTYAKGKLNVSLATSINGAVIAGYSVYPNPVADMLTIKSPYAKAVNVKVYDLFGRLVIESNVIEGQMDVQSLKAGMYNLIVDNKTYFKLIKK